MATICSLLDQFVEPVIPNFYLSKGAESIIVPTVLLNTSAFTFTEGVVKSQDGYLYQRRACLTYTAAQLQDRGGARMLRCTRRSLFFRRVDSEAEMVSVAETGFFVMSETDGWTAELADSRMTNSATQRVRVG